MRQMHMRNSETVSLKGMYHDILRNPRGEVIWDRGWVNNTIVVNCRRVLASFMAGNPLAIGIVGLRLGAGLEQWDVTPPGPSEPNRTALVDGEPYTVAKGDLKLDFLEGGIPTGDPAVPTNRLQIFARLGPHIPDWGVTGTSHLTSSLREFGLVGSLNGEVVLLNYVVHPVITKDPESTLERTIWLVF
jgi:hypothetical protein